MSLVLSYLLALQNRLLDFPNKFREGTIKKYYRAIALGKLKQARDKLVHHLRKGKSLKATVFPRETSAAKRSELSYEVIDLLGKNSLVEITLATGRFHQIRAQMAFIGHPSWVMLNTERPPLYQTKKLLYMPVS